MSNQSTNNIFKMKPTIIMPKFISTKSVNDNSVHICSCTNCKTGGQDIAFSNINDLKKHLRPMKAYLFACPEEGCNTELWTMTSLITTHVKKCHPKLVTKFNLDEPNATLIYCNDCNKYANFVDVEERTEHFNEHRKDSQVFISPPRKNFKIMDNNSLISKIESLSVETPEGENLKKTITEIIKKHGNISTEKHGLEKDCRNGKDCTGFTNGSCAFNHHGNKVVSDKSTTICKYELPHVGTRCTKIKCSFDHLSGRALFIFKKKSNYKKNSESTNETSDVHPTINEDNVIINRSDFIDTENPKKTEGLKKPKVVKKTEVKEPEVKEPEVKEPEEKKTEVDKEDETNETEGFKTVKKGKKKEKV